MRPTLWACELYPVAFTDRGHSGSGEPLCSHPALSHRVSQDTLEGRRCVQLGRGEKAVTKERKRAQSPLPGSLPGYKNKQTYHDYSLTCITNTTITIDCLVYV